MAFNRTKWQDHVVERPRTFTEVTNADGSVTHTPAPGDSLRTFRVRIKLHVGDQNLCFMH